VSQGVTASLATRSAGSFVASPGSAACTPAAAGFYVAASGATSDTACPTGTATTTAGQTECAALPSIFAITSVKALKTGRIRIGLAASATGSFEGQLGARTIKETTTQAGPLTITLAAQSARARTTSSRVSIAVTFTPDSASGTVTHSKRVTLR
jgi:hypothetical protein